MAERETSRHVLVLSDAEEIHLVIRDVLEDEGYRVTSGAYLNGDIGNVTRESPDAILIDCNRMDLDQSVMFLREVRSWPHLREIPIIACTGAVRQIEEYRPQVDELGLRIILKPFDIDELAMVVAGSFAGKPPAAC
jgi:CheY-like chemotaxis protein